jgi:hypothetical protein
MKQKKNVVIVDRVQKGWFCLRYYCYRVLALVVSTLTSVVGSFFSICATTSGVIGSIIGGCPFIPLLFSK